MEVIDVNVKEMNEVMSLFERSDLKRPSTNNFKRIGVNPNVQEKFENIATALLKIDGASEALYNIIKGSNEVHKNYIQVIEYSPGKYYNHDTGLQSDSARAMQVDDTVSNSTLKSLGRETLKYWSDKASKK